MWAGGLICKRGSFFWAKGAVVFAQGGAIVLAPGGAVVFAWERRGPVCARRSCSMAQNVCLHVRFWLWMTYRGLGQPGLISISIAGLGPIAIKLNSGKVRWVWSSCPSEVSAAAGSSRGSPLMKCPCQIACAARGTALNTWNEYMHLSQALDVFQYSFIWI